jgi:proline iminopeptidase
MMHPLYPSIKPYNTFQLPVGDEHVLYVEESGDIDGIPVLFIHGGPGAGCSPEDRRFFDPEKYRIILFDQRGAGRSVPHAELSANTTPDLISDIESIREHLGIDRWVLFGGSWGSTLSLLYAQANPDKVIGMILRGIFLCRQQDLEWFYQHGASQIFPDYWKDFIEPIPPKQRGNMMAAYHALLTGDNELAKMNAAKHWSLWEGRCATLRPNSSVVDTFSNIHLALSLARIEAHYFVNNAFISENQILDNMDVLSDIPATIIHGRYDMVCTLDNAVSLQQVWPNAELHIIREAGHASRDPGILDALVRATDEMAEEIEKNQ